MIISSSSLRDDAAARARLRRLRLVMAGAAIVGLAACGGSGEDPSSEPPPVGTPAPPPGPAPTPAPATPPPPASGAIAVQGQFKGPVAAQVTLQNNGADDLVVTIAPSSAGHDYSTQAFTFATPLPAGSAYAVTVKTSPSGQTCRVVSGASGMVPATQPITVGCEHDADLASRSDSDAVFGTYSNSREVHIAGDATTGEGRFIVFLSSARGITPTSDGSATQVYWRDRLTGQTRLVSRAVDGSPGNGNSTAPAVSADGQTVVFESVANNLSSGDTNGARDVFVWTASGNVVRLVSAGGDRASYDAAVSGDGRKVAFASDAPSFTNNQVRGTNVHLVDLASGARTLVSKRHDNGEPAGGRFPALSHDGSRLAFYSQGAQVVQGDTNGIWDIFVHDAASATNTRASLGIGGTEREVGNESGARQVVPSISGNGRYVAYATTAGNVVANDTNGLQDAFVVDTVTGTTVRVSQTSAGIGGDGSSPEGQGERIALSHDGQWAAFTTAARNLGVNTPPTATSSVLMRNWATGQVLSLSDAAYRSPGAVSMTASGAYVAFLSDGQLDPRFSSTGVFARWTGLGNAWWWTMN